MFLPLFSILVCKCSVIVPFLQILRHISRENDANEHETGKPGNHSPGLAIVQECG